MIIEKIQLNIQSKTVLPFLEEQKHSIFFDIETTGLYWKRSHLYLIGKGFGQAIGFTVLAAVVFGSPHR